MVMLLGNDWVEVYADDWGVYGLSVHAEKLG